ncbi:hypothetical protein OCU04_001262 [Sclerotinia nivalis]|uniref:Uncharacterized protein n=1 Tax=Sclerotinia nivalis TaxID=352851 RepID=A0A9X0B0B1_9HELO|nr:hypothetical protein OCU04_001262 [Sclerotinia nivalis]
MPYLSWRVDYVFQQKALMNFHPRWVYTLYMFWGIKLCVEGWPSFIEICVAVGSFLLWEIFCCIINRWVESTYWVPFRRKVLNGILPFIEDDLDTIDYLICPDFKDSHGRTQYMQCPHLRQQAAKFDILPRFNRLSKELVDHNQRVENAAASSGISPDLESQNLVYRRPINAVPHEQKFRQDGGLHDCNCGKYGSNNPCEHFKPTVVWDETLAFISSPDHRGIECERPRIEEEIRKIHWHHEEQIFSRRNIPVEKGKILEESPYII